MSEQQQQQQQQQQQSTTRASSTTSNLEDDDDDDEDDDDLALTVNSVDDIDLSLLACWDEAAANDAAAAISTGTTATTTTGPTSKSSSLRTHHGGSGTNSNTAAAAGPGRNWEGTSTSSSRSSPSPAGADDGVRSSGAESTRRGSLTNNSLSGGNPLVMRLPSFNMDGGSSTTGIGDVVVDMGADLQQQEQLPAVEVVQHQTSGQGSTEQQAQHTTTTTHSQQHHHHHHRHPTITTPTLVPPGAISMATLPSSQQQQASGTTSTTNPAATDGTTSNRLSPSQQLHPGAILSSASCPPHGMAPATAAPTPATAAATGMPSSVFTGATPMAVPNVNMATATTQQQQFQQQQALQMALSSLAQMQGATPGVTATAPAVSDPATAAALFPLAYNAMAAGAVNLTSLVPAAVAAVAAAASMNPQPGTTATQFGIPGAGGRRVVQAPAPVSAAPSAASSSRKRSKPSTRKSGGGNTKKSGANANNDVPPFLLFDAPVELRHNFAQAQRAHGLPVLQDNNSYHYNLASRGTAGSATGAAAPAPGGLNPGAGPMIHLNNNGSRLMHPHHMPAFASVAAAPHQAPTNIPRLLDARHADAGSKRLKNFKEQKRAQRITELIEQLRVKMEKGGWTVSVKSKFHTLASCSDYVKHLVKVNQEKEEAVKQARNDLEAKKLRKLEDEKIAAQDPSDPESTTTASSLTVSSELATNHGGSEGDVSTPGKAESSRASTSDADESGEKKRSGTTVVFSKDCQDNESKERDAEPLKKKARFTSHESSLSSEAAPSGDCCDTKGEDGGGSSTGSGSGSGSKDRGEGISHGSHSQSTSISDLTDSQKGSSTNSGSKDVSSLSGSDPQSGSGNGTSTDTDKANKRAMSLSSWSGSVSSDAAVGPSGVDRSETDSSNKEVHHADVIIKQRKGKRKDPPTEQKLTDPEATSLDSCFKLDYEEVFLKSNVPQILATPSGRIVAHNEFFLRATGLSPKEVDRLTIFSLVQRGKLSNLFELVAAALRDTNEDSFSNASNHEADEAKRGPVDEGDSKSSASAPGAASTSASSSEGTDSATPSAGPLENYAAMTLPCVNFHGSSSDDDAEDADDESDDASPEIIKEVAGKDKHKEKRARRSAMGVVPKGQLYMTVTLMADADVRKRCFHCMFTNCPGTNGTLGSITPELMAMLFQGNDVVVARKKNPKQQQKQKRQQQLQEQQKVSNKKLRSK